MSAVGVVVEGSVLKIEVSVATIKGTMSPQAHANFFKYHRRVQEGVFICLNRVHLRKVS